MAETTTTLATIDDYRNLIPQATTEKINAIPWVNGVSDETKLAQGTIICDLDGLSTIGKKINECMLPLIAQLIGMEAHKNVKDCKSINQLVMKIMNTDKKGTVSGLVSIAKTCYNSNGTILDIYSKFNYNELQVLAQGNDDLREHMVTWSIDRDFTTKEFREEVEEFKHPTVESTAKEVESATVEQNTESSTAEPKTTESTESTESAESTENTESTESTESSTTEPKATENTKLECEYIMNITIDLRAHIDSLTKKEIAEKLDDIIAKLAYLSDNK